MAMTQTALTTQTVLVMSEAEARAETAAIRTQFEQAQNTWDAALARLRAAEEREIWVALRYTSMARYLTAEFSVSRRHAYRLIEQMRVTLQLLGDSTLQGAGGVTRRVTHRQAKALKTPEAQAQVVELVEEGHTVEEAVEHVTITRAPFRDGAAMEFERYDEGQMILRCKGCQRIGPIVDRFEVMRMGSIPGAVDAEEGIVREAFVD